MGSFLSKVKDLSSQVTNLKVLCLTLSVIAGLESIAVIFLSFRAPLVVERGDSETVIARSFGENPTDSEILSYVRLALVERLNTESKESFLISQVENEKRKQEQGELKKREISQAVLIEGIEVNKETVVARVTRVLSVGNIRSAFPAELELGIEKVRRSRTNPFGLLLTELKSRTKDKEGAKSQ